MSQSTIDLGMYDHLIYCIHFSNNVLNNALGRQDALGGKMFDKNNKNILPHKSAIYFWVGMGMGVKSG